MHTNRELSNAEMHSTIYERAHDNNFDRFWWGLSPTILTFFDRSRSLFNVTDLMWLLLIRDQILAISESLLSNQQDRIKCSHTSCWYFDSNRIERARGTRWLDLKYWQNLIHEICVHLKKTYTRINESVVVLVEEAKSFPYLFVSIFCAGGGMSHQAW